MTRLTDTIIANKAFSRGRTAPMVDLKNGGQNGYMTDFPAYVSNAAYIRRNLIARLIEAPKGFSDLPDGQKWIDTLKTLIELHPKSIEGLNMGLTVEVASNPFGGGGEEQEDPTDVKRARSQPVLGYIEKYGRPINAFYNGWITELIMDPITKVPNIVTRGSKKPADLLPDYIGATVLFFEPDPTFTKIDKAWLCTNMWPKSDGPVEGRRDLTSAGNTQDFTIEFTAISQVGLGVNTLAQKLLDEMNLSGANPNARPAFVDKISADVKAGDKGYAETIAAAGRTALQF